MSEMMSVLHAIGEREINRAQMGFYNNMDLSTPRGHEAYEHDVGDTVQATSCATINQGVKCVILERYKMNGFCQYVVSIVGSPKSRTVMRAKDITTVTK